MRLRILPSSHRQLHYLLLPLVTGNSPIPKVRIKMTRFPGRMEALLQKMMPTHVFVMVSRADKSQLVCSL